MSRRTFLLTWNPKIYRWDDLDDDIQELEESGILESQWSCGMRTHLPIGSRVFLIRLGRVQRGEPPKGIIASGSTCSTPYPLPHWIREKRDRGETALYSKFRYLQFNNFQILALFRAQLNTIRR
jgi:5-methylcytosine-specific restriction protein A